jgi:hypothetical protein
VGAAEDDGVHAGLAQRAHVPADGLHDLLVEGEALLDEAGEVGARDLP